MRYGANARPVPAVFGPWPPLAGFDVEFVVPAAGNPGPLRFAAPADLAAQLAAFEAR